MCSSTQAKSLKKINLPLKVDKLEKYDKCFNKLSENLYKFSKKMTGKKFKTTFCLLSTVL